MSRVILLIMIFSGAISFEIQAQIEDHIITIDLEKTIKKMDFACTDVIDKRANQEHLGIIHIGRKNKKYQAKLEKGFRLSMAFMLAKALPRTKDKTGLTFIFHEYSIQESFEAGKKRASYMVEIEFARKVDSTCYSLGSYDATVHNYMNISSQHDFYLFRALKECINDFNYSDWKDWNGIPLNESEENKVILDLVNEIPQKGLYTSFKRLKNNQPIILKNEYDLHVIGKESRIPYYKIKENSLNTKMKVDFISNDTSLYINSMLYLKNSSKGKNFFVEIIEKGYYTYFEDRDQSHNASVMGGVVGGAIGAGLTNGRIGYVFNTETGVITRLGPRSLFKLIAKHPEIVKTYRSSKRKLADKKAAIMALNKTFEE